MIHQRDDGGLTLPETESLRGFQPADADLFRWVLDFARDLLVGKELSPPEMRNLVLCAFRDYANVRETVAKPQVFLAKRITEMAEARKGLRGVEPASDQRERHLLDVIRTKASLAALPPDARRALIIVYYENGTYEDVAAELGVSVVHVERLLRKVMRKLEAARRQQEPRG